jgi:acyl-coenzyme A thioesterase 13
MTVGVVAREGFWDSGHVSRTLNCTYLRPAPEGTELIVECEIVHLGKSLAELRGVMRRKDNGKVCYICEHGKAKVDFSPMRDRVETMEREVGKSKL